MIVFDIFLVMVLTEKGYICYTSVNPAAAQEQPIPGTQPMTINFRKLHYLSDKVKCFPGSRVGIFDFLALTEAKTVDISSFPSWLFDTNLMYPQSNSTTVYNAIEYLLPMKDYFKKENVHADLKFSHEHIPSEDICYSYEEIFNRVLNDVEKI